MELISQLDLKHTSDTSQAPIDQLDNASMGKSDMTAEEEFQKLEHVLNQTADDTSNCLRLLKKHLSEYDSHNGNHFANTAKSYMRSDMRTAKDTTADLKHVAHQINENKKPSKTEISSARNMMDATAKAMENLNITARNYDRENKQKMGIKGRVDAAIGGHHHRNEKDEQRGEGFIGKSGQEKEAEGGFNDKNDYAQQGSSGNRDDEYGQQRGLGDRDNEYARQGGLGNRNDYQTQGSPGNGNEYGQQGGMGTSDKEHLDKDERREGMPGSEDKNGGIMGSSETVETLVKETLRDNFSLKALDQQITAADKALKPSIVGRAKEKIHDVKEKIKGDKTSPTHEKLHGHQHEGHHADHAVTP